MADQHPFRPDPHVAAWLALALAVAAFGFAIAALAVALTVGVR